jgi:hypothetical protein
MFHVKFRRILKILIVFSTIALLKIFVLLRSESSKFESEITGRAKTLEEKCGDYRKNRREQLGKLDFTFLLVNQEHKFLYCSIPKVACSNWRKIMLELMLHNTNRTDRDNIYIYTEST